MPGQRPSHRLEKNSDIYLSSVFTEDIDGSVSLQGFSEVISKLEQVVELAQADLQVFGVGVGKGGNADLEKGGGMVKSGGVG